jgi:hypothetical protein
MSERWLPIRYRDFYDIPRAFVVEHEGILLFFDCAFDRELDDYGAAFAVYQVREGLRERIDLISWTDLGNESERVGTVPTAAVVFDPTKRKAIRADVLDLLPPRADSEQP